MKYVVCRYCRKKYSSPSYLTVHIEHQHGNKSALLSCDKCDKTFRWKQSLRKHKIMDHKQIGSSQRSKKSIVACQFCEKMFPNRSLLKAHLPKHNDYRPHKCSTCGMLFKHRQTWNRHTKSAHSTKREYKCAKCDKAFKTKSYLSSHEINVHQTHPPATCGYCDKPFKTKKYLHDHVQQVHTMKQERKYVCSSCSLAFISPKDLQRHVEVHSGIKRHKCSICHKSYSRAEYLKVHMKTHGELTEEEVVNYIVALSQNNSVKTK